jgi:3-oxoacyl-[acyl-carrier-protein] synthase II
VAAERSRSDSRRVAITGVGVVSPLGRSAPEHWQRVVQGERGTKELPELASLASRLKGSARWPDDWARWIGAPAEGFEVVPPDDVLERMALRATDDCLASAGSRSLHEIAPDRRGCVLGISKPLEMPPVNDLSHGRTGWMELSSPSLSMAREHDIRGPVLVPSAACATGLISLIRGVELIRDETCEAVLAGSADWSLSLGYLAGYRRLGVLAKAGLDPLAACRPFDRRRQGFVVGCGAAVFLLEDWEHAQRRGAKPYAEWLSHAMAADASSMVDVDVSGETPARVIRDALRRSGVSPAEVDAISLHGTGTRANDVCETRAVRLALGHHAEQLSCFSLKGSIGHLMGAAGSVETATLAVALREQIVPPTMNLDQPDPDCDLDYTANRSRSRPIRNALKLSLGFGGACAAAVLKRVP